MNASWFYEYLTQTTSQYSLKLVENPFSTSHAASPRLLPILRPLQYQIAQNPEDSWVFLGISPKLYEDALEESPSNHIYAVTRDGDIIASKGVVLFPTEPLIERLLSLTETSGTFPLSFHSQTSGSFIRSSPPADFCYLKFFRFLKCI